MTTPKKASSHNSTLRPLRGFFAGVTSTFPTAIVMLSPLSFTLMAMVLLLATRHEVIRCRHALPGRRIGGAKSQRRRTPDMPVRRDRHEDSHLAALVRSNRDELHAG